MTRIRAIHVIVLLCIVAFCPSLCHADAKKLPNNFGKGIVIDKLRDCLVTEGIWDGAGTPVDYHFEELADKLRYQGRGGYNVDWVAIRVVASDVLLYRANETYGNLESELKTFISYCKGASGGKSIVVLGYVNIYGTGRLGSNRQQSVVSAEAATAKSALNQGLDGLIIVPTNKYYATYWHYPPQPGAPTHARSYLASIHAAYPLAYLIYSPTAKNTGYAGEDVPDPHHEGDVPRYYDYSVTPDEQDIVDKDFINQAKYLSGIAPRMYWGAATNNQWVDAERWLSAATPYITSNTRRPFTKQFPVVVIGQIAGDTYGRNSHLGRFNGHLRPLFQGANKDVVGYGVWVMDKMGVEDRRSF